MDLRANPTSLFSRPSLARLSLRTRLAGVSLLAAVSLRHVPLTILMAFLGLPTKFSLKCDTHVTLPCVCGGERRRREAPKAKCCLALTEWVNELDGKGVKLIGVGIRHGFLTREGRDRGGEEESEGLG